MTRLHITKCNIYHLRIMAMLFSNCRQVMSPLLLLRTLWTVWISGSMVTHGAAPSPPIFTTVKVSLLRSPRVLASWFVTTNDYFSRSSKRNETEWSGRTKTPFHLGHSPPPDSTLVCKVYKVPPTCVNFCDARIYYVLSKSDMTRACIHLGMHHHPVSDGIC
jgi:hypothetical protein